MAYDDYGNWIDDLQQVNYGMENQPQTYSNTTTTTPTATTYTDPSTQDTRTQDARIAAYDSPYGSTEYTGTSGRIDNTIGDTSSIEQQLKDYAAANNVAYDQSDLEGILRNTGYQTGGMTLQQALANQLGIYDQRALYDGTSVGDRNTDGSTASGTSSGSGTSSSTSGTSSAWGDRANSLWDILMGRAGQSLNIDSRDPIIANMVNAYRAEQQRQGNDYVDQLAEQMGPNANLSGERRVASENAAQATGSMQAQLMVNELTARREEIQNALSQMGGMLTDQQKLDLERELGLIDASIRQQTLDSNNDQFAANLAYNTADRSRYWDAYYNGGGS